MSMLSNDLNTFVVDCGSNWFKFGYAGDELPRGYFPSVVANRIGGVMADDVDMEAKSSPNVLDGQTDENFCDGVDVALNSLNLTSNHFENYTYEAAWDYSRVKARIPTEYQFQSRQKANEQSSKSGDRCSESPDFSLDVFKRLMHRADHLVNSKGKTMTRDSSVLLSDPDINSLDNAKRITQEVFETLDYSSAYLSKRSVLSLFSVGKTSGLPIQIGASGTSITPVIDGYTLNKNLCWTPFGGDALDKYLMNAFTSESLVTPSEINRLLIPSDTSSVNYWRSRYTYCQVKESLLRVAAVDPLGPKFKSSNTTSSKATYFDLPDGTTLDAHEPPCVYGPEAFFNPQIYTEHPGMQPLDELDRQLGLPDMIRRVVVSSELDARKALLGSISLHGGTTKIPGFQERFAKALFNDAVLNRISKPRIHASTTFHDKQFSAYLGASILGSLSSFKQMWISRAEYEEYGDSIVSMRCL